jgi:hypothetical protein
MVRLAAREHRVARKVSQRIGAEAGLILGFHMRRRSKWSILGQSFGSNLANE